MQLTVVDPAEVTHKSNFRTSTAFELNALPLSKMGDLHGFCTQYISLSDSLPVCRALTKTDYTLVVENTMPL